MKFRFVVVSTIAVCLLDSSIGMGQSGSRSKAKGESANDSPISLAFNESKKTGMPIFALSVAKTCPVCASLMKTMKEDEALQPTLKQFVYLQMDVKDQDFSSWRRKYPPEKNATPAWQVVSARGQQLESGVGDLSGEELKQLLQVSLEKAGRVPSPETMQKLSAAAKAAQDYLQSGQESAALAAMLPVRDEFMLFADGLSMSAEGQEILHVADKLVEIGQKRLQKLSDQVGSENGWMMALALAQARQSLGMLPALQQDLEGVEEQFTADRTNSKLYRAAKDLLEAEALMVAGDEHPKKVELALKRVITRYPNTEAATAAAKLMTKGIEAKTAEVALPKAGTQYRNWTDSTGKFTIQASLVSFDKKQVRLKQKNGKVISVPISKLNQEAQQYLNSQGKSSR